MANIAQSVVLVFGVLIAGMSAFGLFAPDKLIAQVKRVVASRYGMPFAVIVRVLLGITLIIVAQDSQFPRVFQALGWIAIAAAIGLAFMGQVKMQRFVSWFERFSSVLIRVWLLFGVAFGLFLIYGVS